MQCHALLSACHCRHCCTAWGSHATGLRCGTASSMARTKARVAMSGMPFAVTRMAIRHRRELVVYQPLEDSILFPPQPRTCGRAQTLS